MTVLMYDSKTVELKQGLSMEDLKFASLISQSKGREIIVCKNKMKIQGVRVYKVFAKFREGGYKGDWENIMGRVQILLQFS